MTETKQVRKRKICDYEGYACECRGYTKGSDPIFKTHCKCGHSKAWHNKSSANYRKPKPLFEEDK